MFDLWVILAADSSSTYLLISFLTVLFLHPPQTHTEVKVTEIPTNVEPFCKIEVSLLRNLYVRTYMIFCLLMTEMTRLQNSFRDVGCLPLLPWFNLSVGIGFTHGDSSTELWRFVLLFRSLSGHPSFVSVSHFSLSDSSSRSTLSIIINVLGWSC